MAGSIRRFALLALTAALGLLGGCQLGSGVHSEQHRVLIERELEGVSACVDALRALEGLPAGGAQDRLRAWLVDSIKDLNDLTLIDVELDARELLDSLRLAEAWAREHGLAETALQAARVLQRLEQA
jgi:hypothetical protein